MARFKQNVLRYIDKRFMLCYHNMPSGHLVYQSFHMRVFNYLGRIFMKRPPFHSAYTNAAPFAREIFAFVSLYIYEYTLHVNMIVDFVAIYRDCTMETIWKAFVAVG